MIFVTRGICLYHNRIAPQQKLKFLLLIANRGNLLIRRHRRRSWVISHGGSFAFCHIDEFMARPLVDRVECCSLSAIHHLYFFSSSSLVGVIETMPGIQLLRGLRRGSQLNLFPNSQQLRVQLFTVHSSCVVCMVFVTLVVN